MRNYCESCGELFDDYNVLRRGKCPNCGDRLIEDPEGFDPEAEMKDMFDGDPDDGFSPNTFFDR